MSPVTFFAVSGGIAWAYLVWRFIVMLKNLPNRARQMRRRLMWAVSGKPARQQGVIRSAAR